MGGFLSAVPHATPRRRKIHLDLAKLTSIGPPRDTATTKGVSDSGTLLRPLSGMLDPIYISTRPGSRQESHSVAHVP